MKYFLLLILITFSYSQNVPTQHQPIFKYAHLKSNADSINANGDFSSAEDTFVIAPPLDQSWVLNGMTVTIADSLTSKSNVYGGETALDSGIAILKTRAGSQLYSLTNGTPIKNNEEWGRVSCDVTYHLFNASDDYIQINWCFVKSGQAILLDGTQSDSLIIVLNDDLSSITGHYFFFRGFNKGTRP